MTTFAGLVQLKAAYGDPIITHVEVKGTWYQMDEIETTLVLDDFEVFTKTCTSKEFNALLKLYGLMEIRNYHDKGWFYFLGSDDRKLIKQLNEPEWIAEHMRAKEMFA